MELLETIASNERPWDGSNGSRWTGAGKVSGGGFDGAEKWVADRALAPRLPDESWFDWSGRLIEEGLRAEGLTDLSFTDLAGMAEIASSYGNVQSVDIYKQFALRKITKLGAALRTLTEEGEGNGAN